MKYIDVFLDTEFNQKTLELISIALVKDPDNYLYMMSSEFNHDNCDEFVKKNVLPFLEGMQTSSLAEIRTEVEKFMPKLPPHQKYRVWAWFGSYDWVLFMKLWKNWDHYPFHLPFYFHDYRVELERDGNYQFSPRNFYGNRDAHDALVDAMVLREAYVTRANSKEQGVII